MLNTIKILRKTLQLSQPEFAKPLGVVFGTISYWEKSGKVPEAAIISICRTFNVRREWLETGDGDMFETPEPPQISPEDFAKTYGCDDFTAGIFARFCRFSEEDKARFSELLQRLIANPESVIPPQREKIVVKNQVSGGAINGDVGSVNL